jgi:hypothetical protein
MEILVQCVDDLAREAATSGEAAQLWVWHTVAALLRQRPRLHASTIAYWARFGVEDPEEQFQVSAPMRQIWAEVRSELI